MKKRVIFIVGPTAVGKSKAAAYLASRINAEIISCDSMQVYKGMDILTSQPPLRLRNKIRHHLIGLISPGREYNVSQYRQQAVKKIKEIIKRGCIPLFVGGTGLYMSIVLDGIFKEGTQHKSIRKRLYRQAKLYGRLYLYNRLKKADPRAAAKIHPHDTRRIIRALEVFQATGKPISQLQKQRKGLGAEYALKIFCLDMPRDKLYQRIDARVEKMFKQGLAAEVKKLLKLKLSRTASCAIGIKELKGYFDGLYDLREAKRRMKRNSRQYAKRQLSWFRKDKRIEWIEVKDKDTLKAAAQKIWKKLY